MIKKLFSLLLAAVMILCLAACGSSGEDSSVEAAKTPAETAAAQTGGAEKPAATEKPTDAQAAEAPPAEDSAPEETEKPVEYKENTQEVYYVGDTFHDGNIDITFVSLENTGSFNEIKGNTAGMTDRHYIKACFAFTNTSSEAFGRAREDASLLNFKATIEEYDDWVSDREEELDPGKSATGYVYLLMANENDDYFFYKLENVPSELSETIKLCATEEKDSGYAPEKDTTPSPGVMHVGDTFEEPDLLKLKYLSCKPAEVSEWKKRDGFHWVTCEVEFEDQDTNQEEHVAQFSLYDSNIYCYADGIRCVKDWFDSLHFEDLNKGEKTVMSVTFEVPDGAQTVEMLIHSYYRGVNMMFDASQYAG